MAEIAEKLRRSDNPAAGGAALRTGRAPARTGGQQAEDSVPRTGIQAAETLIDAQGGPACLPSGEYISVEHALKYDEIVLLAGWASASVSLRIPGLIAKRGVRRPDAEKLAGHPTVGFIMVMTAAGDSASTTLLAAGAKSACRIPVVYSQDREHGRAAVSSLRPLLAPLLPQLLTSASFGAQLFEACTELPPAMRNRVHGFVDEVQSFEGFGCVSYGWAIACDDYQFWLAGAGGHWRPLKDAVRYNRPDVDGSFGQEFGPHTAEAGFFCALPGEASGELRLIAAGHAGCFVVHGRQGRPGPSDPLGYARWAFSLPTPFSRFNERLDKHDGPLLGKLIETRRTSAPDRLESWDCGVLPDAPAISVVIPLYGNLRFVEHQLLAFSGDDDFRSGRAELIYVLDDPRIVEEMRGSGTDWWKLYGVPFRTVWGGYNRGYSGANNLGVRVARGDAVIFVNSDVFPLQPGWCAQMQQVLDADADVCAAGARLEYPDGGLQHLGMRFEYSEALAVWLNRHPGQGLECPVGSGQPLAVPAATGACLAVRRRDFLAAGGMDEEYLIGDFEDSDLCLRLAGEKRRVVVLPDTRLVHLERQSFSLLGSPDFRLSVTRYNAWRHSKRWGDRISKLSKESVK